ncbi:MAG TPA: ATP-binding cassette domain-containing protein [Chitinophagaceae bacterium]|jgi:ABC-type lipopolysaccharide export system ATPase subunit|nr:ATP-binding cassette domain-containing protein [Chitinophagaceae bacterium]
MTHTLEADSILLEFNGRKILSDIYLKCETGKITGLLGRNGEGKSCLMKIIYGTLKCEKSIRFDNLVQYEAFKRSNLVLYLPPFHFILKRLSLKRIFNDFDLEYSSFEKRFAEFSLRYKSSINTLSGGEWRLVELYIIIKSKSYFALLDEPFTHLSPIQVEKVKEFILEEKQNKGLLITDHLFQHVTNIADSLYVLKDGKTYLTATIDDVEKFGYAKNLIE